MKYIYTVKPLKEAIEIAIKCNYYDIDENGDIVIYGIYKVNWPAGVSVKSTARIIHGSIRKVGKLGFSIPLIFFTETKEKEEKDVPKFIKNLYTAITAACPGVKCDKCPLSLTAPISCEQLAAWLEERYPEL